MILYKFDPVSKVPSGQETVKAPEGIDDPRLLSTEQLWKKLGRKGAPSATIWSPEGFEGDAVIVFEGNGWMPLPSADWLAENLIAGDTWFDYKFVQAHDMVLDVLNALQEFTKDRLDAIGAGYSPVEQRTFTLQYEEALRVKEDASSEAPMLSAIAQAEGQSVENLAETIIEKHLAAKQAEIDFVVCCNVWRRNVKRWREEKDVGALEEAVAFYQAI